MKKTYHRWTEAEVLLTAEYFVSERVTILDLEKIFRRSHSSIHWNFMNKLEDIDPNLYEQVKIKLEYNKHNHKQHTRRKKEV